MFIISTSNLKQIQPIETKSVISIYSKKTKRLTGANVHQTTDRGETGLYLAVSHHIRHPDTKDASCIHALYHAGVDINAVTYNGYTALQLAAVFGHTPLVCWLLSKNARNIGYPDAYMLARSQGKFI